MLSPLASSSNFDAKRSDTQWASKDDSTSKTKLARRSGQRYRYSRIWHCVRYSYMQRTVSLNSVSAVDTGVDSRNGGSKLMDAIR